MQFGIPRGNTNVAPGGIHAHRLCGIRVRSVFQDGGLADVIGALPPALASLGFKVTVFLPRYRQTKLDNPQTVIPSITVPFDDRYRFCSLLDGGVRSGVQFYFIEYPPYFDREGLYGTPLGDYHDNAERFALFCRPCWRRQRLWERPTSFIVTIGKPP